MPTSRQQKSNTTVHFGSNQELIVPNRWVGEVNCIVGPFSSQPVAAYFANSVVDLSHHEVFCHRIFPKRDAWYVEIQPVLL